MYPVDRLILEEFSSGCLEIHANTWDTQKSFGIGILKENVR